MLPLELCGKSASEKIAELRAKIREEDADGIFVSKLDEIAWLFNIRGNDIPCNPVVMSHAWVSAEKAVLFLQPKAVTAQFREELRDQGVEIRDYFNLDAFLKFEIVNKSILLDPDSVSYSHFKLIKKYAHVIQAESPISAAKAVKNETELNHIRKIYLKDSLALVKYIHSLVTGIGSRRMTEMSAAEDLLKFRKAIPEYIEPSFETISAYGENAAMMHYAPSEENPVELKAEKMLLLDSGGQYTGGTTDVTRTIILGEISEEERHAFTLTACAMLNLLYARFLSGSTGRNLDVIARMRMWNEGIDYKCGTGHGIGFMLNVHEGPHGIRIKTPENGTDAVLLPGMLVTDEPGVYRAGRYGVRTENVLLVKDDIETEDGQFLCFENLTFVPIDDKGMDRSIMSERELSLYIKYQTSVCEALYPYLTEEERVWIKEYAGI